MMMNKKIIPFILITFSLSFFFLRHIYKSSLRNDLKGLIEANHSMTQYQGLNFDLTSIGPFILFEIRNSDRYILNYLKITTEKNIFERTLTPTDTNNLSSIHININVKNLNLTANVSLKSSTILSITLNSFIITMILTSTVFLINLLIERNKKRELLSLAIQVAHDIRSPLEVLKQLDGNFSNSDEQQKHFKMSVDRIEEISLDLLNKKRNKSTENDSKKQEENLNESLKEIINEKQFEYKYNKNILITSSIIPGRNISITPQGLLKRIVSNLINNSADAIKGSSGEIHLSLQSTKLWNIIEIKDNGHGIPASIQEKIFTQGFTTKKDGNGLGLSAARLELEKIGGRIEVVSKLNQGSTFKILLPRIDSKQKKLVVLIDDDKLIRSYWENSASKKNISFRSYSTIESFLEAGLSHDVTLYIDSSLENSIQGEIESKKLFEMGYHTIYLATGYSDLDINDFPWLKGIITKSPPF